MDLQKILGYEFYNNTLQELILAGLVFLVVVLGLVLIKVVIFKRLGFFAQRSHTRVDDALLGGIAKISLVFYIAIALYFSTKQLVLPEIVVTGIKAIVLVCSVYEVIKLVERVVKYLLHKHLNRRRLPTEEERKVSDLFFFFLKLILWILGALLILSNMGVNVVSILAGLGIGGLAVSLALQNILGDLFSSFSIAMDRPFQEGDFIIIGKDMGTVKKIGLKTTRIETLQGEELVISNNELTTSRVQNFKRMHRRRVVFMFDVLPDSSTDQLKKIPEIVKTAVLRHEKADFDRAHFQKFSEIGHHFEVVYFLNNSDHNFFMDTQQAINLEILDEFKKQGITLSFPRIVYTPSV